MVILLPTYKRTIVIPYVIQSILQCDVRGFDERVLILVVNNHYPDKAVIEDVLGNCEVMQPFEIKAIHRQQPLAAIESWFMAIFDHALENEVIVLLGDDDLLLPRSIRRVREVLTKHQADMVVTDYYNRIYFSLDAQSFVFVGDELPSLPRSTQEVVPFSFMPSHALPASFISTHAYRNTQAFREGYEQAIAWCRTQHWAPWVFTSGLLPTWMSFAIKRHGGSVLKLPEKNVIRGHLLSDLLKQEYADGGSTVFYALLDYQMFTCAEVHEDQSVLEANKQICMNTIQAGALDLLLTRAVSSEIKCNAIRHARLKWLSIIVSRKAILGGLLYLLKRLPMMRGWRVRQALTKQAQPTSKLMEFISSL